MEDKDPILSCIVNTLVADVLTVQGARASAATVMTLLSCKSPVSAPEVLTHWGRVTHICVNNLTTIGSVNGLSPGRRQAIIWTNAGILFIGLLGTNFSEILIEIPIFSFKKMRLKVSSAKWRPFCLGLNVLTHCNVMITVVLVSIGSNKSIRPLPEQKIFLEYVTKITKQLCCRNKFNLLFVVTYCGLRKMAAICLNDWHILIQISLTR